MRGLARAERGLERPPEPDNCCMSGCVNCVWDTFREEVEEWAAARKRQSRQDSSRASGASGASRRGTGGIGEERGRVKGMDDDGGVAGGVGDLDEPGGLSGYEGVDLADEEMFWGVPVGIREFMNTEKRLRERRATEKYV